MYPLLAVILDMLMHTHNRESLKDNTVKVEAFSNMSNPVMYLEYNQKIPLHAKSSNMNS